MDNATDKDEDQYQQGVDKKTGVAFIAIESLTRIAKIIRNTYGTGQRPILIKAIAGLYDGHKYQFDLTSLRSLDGTLARACLHVIVANTLQAKDEIHNWGVFDSAELHVWLSQIDHVRDHS